MGGFLLLVIVIASVLFYIYLLRPEKITEEMRGTKVRSYEKYQVPEYVKFEFNCLSGAMLLQENQPYCMWTDDGKIKFLQEYVDSYLEIPIHSINFFQAKGEAGYITEVSGGGGGGSSVGGAIVGGMIAGPTGAIIGSRKKNEAVTSTARYVDSRKTILSFTQDGNEKILVFDKGKLYDELLIICPEKEFEIVRLKSLDRGDQS